jgi:large subunit ribosomal protein L1
VVRAGIGKASFEPAALEANALALTRAVLALRPKGVKGGAASGYIVRANVSSTMGPGFLVSTQALVQAAQTAR